MTPEEMRIRKKQLHLTNAQISQQSGVPVSTVRKILAGLTVSPRAETLQALEKVLKGREKETSQSSFPSAEVLQDSSNHYASAKNAERKTDSKRLTIADRDALPGYRNSDLPNTELIDGVIYDMDAMREISNPGASEVTIYGFEDCIPVMIWNGDFSVDMNRIAEYLGEIGLEQ